MASSEAVLRLRSGFRVPSESPWVGLSDGTLFALLRSKLSEWQLFVFRPSDKILGTLYVCTTKIVVVLLSDFIDGG